MPFNITRVFHMIHPAGQVFALHDETTGVYTPYFIECKEGTELTGQLPVICTECNLNSGVRSTIKIGEYLDDFGHTVELYVVIVNGGNNVRAKPTIGQYGGRWVQANVLETKVTGKVAGWVAKLKELRSWTLEDYIKYKVRY